MAAEHTECTESVFENVFSVSSAFSAFQSPVNDQRGKFEMVKNIAPLINDDIRQISLSSNQPVGRRTTCLSPRWLVWGIVCLFSLGCASTHHDHLEPIRQDFFANRLPEATQVALEIRDKKPREKNVLNLDLAMIELANGNPGEAERLLREVRDDFEDLDQVNVAAESKSLITDDTHRDYSGEDYEQVLIRVMLALSNLMNGGDDAVAYSLQIADKQQKLAQRNEKLEVDDKLKKEAYQQVALGPYIRAMIAEESPLTLDDALRNRVQVASYAPDFRDAQTDIQRVKNTVAIPPGHGIVYVFTLVGHGPVKHEEAEVVTQAALLVADQIVSATSSQSVPPTFAPVKIPVVKTSIPVVEGISVSIDGEARGQTATIVDVGRMARLQNDAHQPEVIGRAVARRVLKKGTIYVAKEAAEIEPTGVASLLFNVAGVAWEATERADLRCWGLLPDKIQVLRLTVPAGEHELVLRAGENGSPASTRIQVPDGKNLYVLGNFPDRFLVGKLLQSLR